ncbi:hypothetical protein OUZ56_004046 [Daphnia magna]|uniref:Protein kinase domain-containing protein n=1 Tax=Daphnia magna TaxID=35525 RepID=A0ABQ9YNK8_9CRUS|nr:hypothetical protein OUZ56_004046 [Daphnia magna]
MTAIALIMAAPNQPEWTTLGKLSLPKSAQTNAKSVEVLVFQGLYDGKIPVTIKRAKKSLSVVDKKILKDINHPSITRYYTTEADEEFYYIATEISTDTLEVLALKGVEGRKNTEPESAKPAVGTHKDVLHQITRAVAYLHDKKIIHGNINPQSIVICSQEPTLNDLKPSPRAKLANFEVEGAREGWKAPEYELKPEDLSPASDVFSLGVVFAYLLSNGLHPFGPVHLQQSNILFGFLHLSEEKLNDPSAVDLMKRMLDSDPTTRITIKGVLGHPYFMGAEEAIAFICKAVDEVLKPEMNLVNEGGESSIINELRNGEQPIIRGYWKQYLTPYVRKLIERRSYDAKSLPGLLLAIRDKAVQYADQSPEVKAEFGSKPEGYWIYWSTLFPSLLIHTWRVIVGRLGSNV